MNWRLTLSLRMFQSLISPNVNQFFFRLLQLLFGCSCVAKKQIVGWVLRCSGWKQHRVREEIYSSTAGFNRRWVEIQRGIWYCKSTSTCVKSFRNMSHFIIFYLNTVYTYFTSSSEMFCFIGRPWVSKWKRIMFFFCSVRLYFAFRAKKKPYLEISCFVTKRRRVA